MSDFWSWYIITIVVINIVGCWGLLYFTRNLEGEQADDGTTGHEYDGIKEYNNPLPRWWLYMFYITIVYSIGYLVVYPGLGNYKGTFGWTSAGQHAEEVAAAKKEFGPIFAKYAKLDVEELVKDKKAVTMGQRIFANTCFACHGSDARGAAGYPNLTDNDWLYDATPDGIKLSITNGRNGMMPPQGAILGDDLKNVVGYVMALSGRDAGTADVDAGKAKYEQVCFVCHQSDGTGNPMLGAPNLTDMVWLYGGSAGQIEKSIKDGRTGVMPAHKDILTAEQIHLVTGYIYSLSAE
ncbi:MAG: cytochrome-c oxidase, cbb3-type subunit III [Gammaproteobacteria bacterium]|nr:cytochrome-c oxidase, cbb3-type subunit III [Gammaproteobacteria bacterium]